MYDFHNKRNKMNRQNSSPNGDKYTYLRWQNFYILFSTLVVCLSITTFICATMPNYRLETVWSCSYQLGRMTTASAAAAEGTSVAFQALLAAVPPAGEIALNISSVNGSSCYLGSPYFEWEEGVVPLESGTGPAGFIHPDLKELPEVMSLGGIIYESGDGFVVDNVNTTIDNCLCTATETAKLDKTLEDIDFACFIFFAAEAVIRFLAYRKKKKWFWNILNWVDLIALVPGIYGLVFYHLYGKDTLTTTTDVIDAGASEGALDQASALHVFRVVRMVRMFRLLRLSKYFVGITIFAKAINDSKKALLQLFFMIMIVSIVFATIIFHIEHEDEEPFGTSFQSIPSGIWWASEHTAAHPVHHVSFLHTPCYQYPNACTRTLSRFVVAIPFLKKKKTMLTCAHH